MTVGISPIQVSFSELNEPTSDNDLLHDAKFLRMAHRSIDWAFLDGLGDRVLCAHSVG